ncbi:MAG TPA: VWA domain-containing protein [Pyrinomonadaceae bacterium]|jgi:Ca-activated chloride channel family protein
MKRRPHHARTIARLACLVLILFQLAATPTGTAQQKPDAPIATPQQQSKLTWLTVTVTDGKDGYAWGLDRSAFTVYDNKVQQEIAFFKAEDAPASVGILLDTSSSMGPGDTRFKLIREGLARFINLSPKMNEYFVIGFNESPYILSDWTRDGRVVLESLSNVKARKNTALYDACYVGIEQVVRGTHRKRVLLIIADGEDNESRHSLKDVRRRLKPEDVLVYAVAIAPVEFSQDYSSPMVEGQYVLDQLASLSGGKVLVPQSKAALNAAFEQIALELRRQYTIGFTPSSDGKWHSVKVKVTPPANAPREMQRLSARTREGYEAPAASPR